MYRPREALERARFWIALAEADLGEEKPSRLIPDWRWVLRKAHSIRVAGVVSLVCGAIGPVFAMLPPELRAYVPFPLMIAVFAGLAISRLLKQK